jgi:hypothetical protein
MCRSKQDKQSRLDDGTGGYIRTSDGWNLISSNGSSNSESVQCAEESGGSECDQSRVILSILEHGHSSDSKLQRQGIESRSDKFRSKHCWDYGVSLINL